MSIGIFFSDIRPYLSEGAHRYDAAFARLRENGITGLQFRDAEILEEGEEPLLAAMGRHGLHTDVIHICIPLMSADHAIFDTAVQYAHYTLPLLTRFGCRRLMIVPRPKSDVVSREDRSRAQDAIIQGLRRILDATPDSVEILVENYSFSQIPFSTARDIEVLLSSLPRLGFILDTGNFHCVGESPHHAYSRFKDRISAVHVKNCSLTEDVSKGVPVDGNKRMITLPFSHNVMELESLLRTAARDGMDPPLVMEHNPHTPWEEIIDNSELLQQIFSKKGEAI